MMNKNLVPITEREHLFTPNINIVMKVTIGGSPSVADIKTAIGCAVRANESLNCKIVLSEDGFAGYERLEQPVYSVEIRNQPWEEIAREQESRIFHLEAGELVRFFLLPGESDTELLVIAHHLAGDGLSIAYLIEDIMNSLAGNKLEFKPMQIISADSFPQNTEMHLTAKMYLNRLNRKWKKSGRVFSFSDYETLFAEYWKSCKTSLCYEKFSKNEFNRLSEKAKQYNISVNSLITTVLIQAYCYVYGTKANVGLAASIREKGYRGMTNNTTGIAFLYKYRQNKSFSQNVQAVHKSIYKKLKSDRMKYFVPRFFELMDSTLIDAAAMTTYGSYKNKAAEHLAHLMMYDKQRDVSITNLSKLDVPREYGPYAIRDFVFAAPIVPYTRRVTAIATLGEELCVTMHVVKDENIEKEKLFFSKAMHTLKNIS